MATARNIQKNFSIRGTVSRVVPGRLFYVDACDSDRVFAVKLNTLLIRNEDGSVRRYRGEPFRSLGLKVGTPVTVESAGDETQVLLDLTEALQKRRIAAFSF
jgi:hypothetical protein